jgi:hypothetical protein
LEVSKSIEAVVDVVEVGKVLDEPLNGGVVVDEGEIDDELEVVGIEKTKEEVKAEGTRKRLEELERVKKNEKEKPAESRTGERLEESIKRLSRMSIVGENRGNHEKEKEDGMIVEEP